MTKHITRYNSISSSKAATLYSPCLVTVTEGGNSRMLVANIGPDNTECFIHGDTLNELYIVTGNSFILNQSKLNEGTLG